MSFHLQPTQLTLKPEYLLNSSNLLNVPLGRSHSNVWWNFEKHVLNDMVDGIGHPPTTTRNNTKTKTKKRCNNLHYTHLHCLHFYMYLGMTIVEQPTLLFCRHNKFCYDMKQTTLQSWSNLPTQSLMMESPLFSGSRTHLKFRRRMPCVCAGLKFVISANGKGCSYSISISKSISQDPICATLPSTTPPGQGVFIPHPNFPHGFWGTAIL